MQKTVRVLVALTFLFSFVINHSSYAAELALDSEVPPAEQPGTATPKPAAAPLPPEPSSDFFLGDSIETTAGSVDTVNTESYQITSTGPGTQEQTIEVETGSYDVLTGITSGGAEEAAGQGEIFLAANMAPTKEEALKLIGDIQKKATNKDKVEGFVEKLQKMADGIKDKPEPDKDGNVVIKLKHSKDMDVAALFDGLGLTEAELDAIKAGNVQVSITLDKDGKIKSFKMTYSGPLVKPKADLI